MTTTIDKIDINGREYPLELFPANVKALVTQYEITLQQYNEAAVTAAALGMYLNKTSNDVQLAAKAALEDMLGAKSENQVAEAEDLVASDADDNK